MGEKYKGHLLVGISCGHLDRMYFFINLNRIASTAVIVNTVFSYFQVTLCSILKFLFLNFKMSGKIYYYVITMISIVY